MWEKLILCKVFRGHGQTWSFAENTRLLQMIFFKPESSIKWTSLLAGLWFPSRVLLQLSPLWLFHLFFSLFFPFICFIDPSLGAMSSFPLPHFSFCSFSFLHKPSSLWSLSHLNPCSFSYDFVFSSLFLSISFCSFSSSQDLSSNGFGVLRGTSYHVLPHYSPGCAGGGRQTGSKQSRQLAPEKPWLGVCGPLPSTCSPLVETSRSPAMMMIMMMMRTGSLRGWRQNTRAFFTAKNTSLKWNKTTENELRNFSVLK